MKYGLLYKSIEFSSQVKSIIDHALKEEIPTHSAMVNNDPNDPVTESGKKYKDYNPRVSEIGWIHDQRLQSVLLDSLRLINENAGWGLRVSGLEPIQYGIYPEGGFYDWHIDQHPQIGEMDKWGSTGAHHLRERSGKLVRKISMTYWLNDPEEYEGGELDLEIYNPKADPRYTTLKLPAGHAVFFQSDVWHRVRPVTKGIRKSLVAWFSGPPYV